MEEEEEEDKLNSPVFLASLAVAGDSLITDSWRPLFSREYFHPSPSGYYEKRIIPFH